MRILVAYDGSSCAEAAVDEVVRRPWPARSEVRLVTAVERPALDPSSGAYETCAAFTERVAAAVREEAYRNVQKALERLRSRPDLEPSYELRDGAAKEALLEAIREWKPDLVLAGSHGRSNLDRLFLGSVSHALVTHAPCNVEIVRASRAA
jgi:nucleotide-binding universal stress UspA family protein